MDAEPAPPNLGHAEVAPSNPDVWLRLGGRWSPARIVYWFRVGPRWAVWVEHALPDGLTWPDYAAYWYDRSTVREREAGEPPPDG